jgi:hypothetical protein
MTSNDLLRPLMTSTGSMVSEYHSNDHSDDHSDYKASLEE